MREPPLPFEQFKNDRVLSREIILDGRDPIRISGAAPAGGVWSISAIGKAAVTLHPPQTDLSRFNSLSLTLENLSPAVLLVGVTIIHGSEAELPDSAGTSFSGGRETVLSGSPRVLLFPRESFGTYGHPRGWSDVREIRLTFGRERTYEGPEEIEILFHRLEGEIRSVPQGPRLTQEGLKSVLCCDVPGVTELFGTFDRNERLVASLAAPKSLRSFSPVDSGLHIPPPHPYPHSGPEEIVAGTIMGQNLGYPIPWDANPTGELEWTHFLNRHHFLRDLAASFARTGDPRCVTVLDSTVGDWIEKNPVPVGSNGGAGASWETLSAAWRLREWLWVIATVWHHSMFRKETRIAMLCSIWEHAQHLLDHQGHPNNWIIVESAALTLTGLCFPEFAAADTWLKTGLSRLQAEVDRQFFSDGVLYEISPMYHAICFQALLEVKQAAAETGKGLFEDFDELLRKSAEYLSALCRPDFTWPSLNDSGGCAGDYTALMTKAGELLGSDELMWTGSRGRVGIEPTELSHWFRDAGIVAMRSHHGSDAHFLVFRGGPPGGFHHHDDALSLDVSAAGRPVLVDPGITGYAPGPLTDYYRSAAAHNMILIDGKGPLRAGMCFKDKVRPALDRVSWSRQPPLEIAAGISFGPWAGVSGELTVLRTVIFVRKSYWIVRDMVVGLGLHEVTTCWTFAPGRLDVGPKNNAATFVDGEGTGLLLLPLTGDRNASVETAEGWVEPPMGWVSLNGNDVPAPACRYCVTASLPLTVVWGLFPTSTTLRGPTHATSREGDDDAVILEIVLANNHRDVLTLVPPVIEPTGLFQAPLHGSIALH